MDINLNKKHKEISDLLETYTSLQKRVRQRVNEISKLVEYRKKSNISIDKKNKMYIEETVDSFSATE